MAFGFPPRHSEQLSLSAGPADLHAAVRDSLNTLAWTVKQDGGQSLRAAVGVSLFSYGERVQIQVESDRTLRISSRNVFPLQFYDWGKNKRNVERFVSELRRRSVVTPA